MVTLDKLECVPTCVGMGAWLGGWVEYRKRLISLLTSLIRLAPFEGVFLGQQLMFLLFFMLDRNRTETSEMVGGFLLSLGARCW